MDKVAFFIINNTGKYLALFEEVKKKTVVFCFFLQLTAKPKWRSGLLKLEVENYKIFDEIIASKT